MTSIESNVNSYDAGKNPYKHDDTRGKWKSMFDFYLVCIGHAFASKNFFLFLSLDINTGASTLLPLILSLFTVAIPIYFIQSILGQFSSTGFISVFRISPLFKGIGYVSMVLNVLAAVYFSIIAAQPLLYFFASMCNEYPWTTCNNTWNTENCTMLVDHLAEYGDNISYPYFLPNEEFLENYVQNTNQYFIYPWLLLPATFGVWIIIAFFQRNGIKSLTNIMRFTAVIPLIIAPILFIRFAMFPNAMSLVWERMAFDIHSFIDLKMWVKMPFLVIFTTQGSGWGIILTLASHTEYKTDTMKYSIAIPFIMVILTYFGNCLTNVIIGAFSRPEYITALHHYSSIEFPYYTFLNVINEINVSNFWAIIFFGMIFMCEINALAVHMFTICTALFDEYVKLRPYKYVLRIGSCAAMFLLTIFVLKSIELGELFFIITPTIGAFTLSGIGFLELIMVLWVYGRQRFQRDVNAMIGRIFSTWKFFIIRFITPLCSIFVTFIYLAIAIFMPIHPKFLQLTLCTLPWLWIIGYAVYKIATTPGTLRRRFQKCTRPNDWYPANPVDRQEYEARLGEADTSHQLLQMDYCANQLPNNQISS